MLLMYVGDDNEIDLIPNSVYEVKKVQDDFLGEGYSIFDEGDDWYWYSKEFVEKNSLPLKKKIQLLTVRILTNLDGGGYNKF